MIKYCCNRCGIEVKIDKQIITSHTNITAFMTKRNKLKGAALESESRCIFCEPCMEEIRKFCKAEI